MTEENEIIDGRTGEIIPKGEVNTLPQRDVAVMQVNANTVGTLELSDQAIKALDEPLNPEDVRIRPDGLLYLPWTWYAKRLNDAFGRLGWGLIPQGSPQSKDTGNNNVLVVWGFWLMVKGIPVSFSMGETSYRTNNNTMSYADAVTGAKSIALARNCKEMGMALQLWDADWVKVWKQKYAETYEYNGKTQWRKKGLKPKTEKTATENQSESEEPETPMLDQAKELAEGMTKNKLSNTDVVNEIKQLTGKSVPEIIAVINALPKGEKRTIGQIVRQLKGE